MTSFGIEWDTNLTACDMLETDAGFVDAGLTNRGAVVLLQNDLIKIQSENRTIGRYTRRRPDDDSFYTRDEFMDYYGEEAETRWREADPLEDPAAMIEGDDCLFTLEAVLGPVFSRDSNTFNREGMSGLFGEFDHVWGQILANRSINYPNGRLRRNRVNRRQLIAVSNRERRPTSRLITFKRYPVRPLLEVRRRNGKS
jgi:hypothetical protein